MDDFQHEQRALKWTIYLVLLVGGAYIWYAFIRPSPWGLVVGTEFWVDWRVYCFPCATVGEPWGPAPDASVARINSILGAMVLWILLVFAWLAQLAVMVFPVVYALYRLSKRLDGDTDA